MNLLNSPFNQQGRPRASEGLAPVGERLSFLNGLTARQDMRLTAEEALAVRSTLIDVVASVSTSPDIMGAGLSKPA